LIPSLIFLLLTGASPELQLRQMLRARSGVVRLPRGVIEISEELRLPEGAHDLTITGDGTMLRAANNFRGRALLVCRSGRRISFRNFAMDGNRAALEKPLPIQPADIPFSVAFPSNGLLVEESDDVRIEHVDLSNIANFGILVNHSKHLLIAHVTIASSGSRNALGRNNTSGGVLLEQGTEDFTVADSAFHDIRGNAVWTHAYTHWPRNLRGRIANNQFADISRDAIQVGHASEVTVVGNTGRRIGFRVEEVDVEGGGQPVAIDTGGNVDRSTYEYNHFEEISGKCFDLDGFHDGTVRGNVCINRGKAEDYVFGNFGISFNNTSPEMQSWNVVVEDNRIEGTNRGAIYLIGSGHRIVHNTLVRLNMAQCRESMIGTGCPAIPGQPKILTTGIYLAAGAERPAPARSNTIEDNVINGWKMAQNCVGAASGVNLQDNVIRGNRCGDQ
jgi:hypothetical protein